jgi:chromosomal replication initiation ATPase DnaA
MRQEIDYPAYYKIVRDVLKEYKLEWDHIENNYRAVPITAARWEIIWRIRRELGYSTPVIGKLVKCDHSTVVYCLKMMRATNGMYQKNKYLKLAKNHSYVMRKIKQDILKRAAA